MYQFHTTIHARPAEAVAGEPVNLNGQPFGTLKLAPQLLGTSLFACTFEQASSRLTQLPRMYCEPDGSFVWTSSRDEIAWQVDGNLYDRADRLLFVDAKGSCPPAQLDRLLAALGWPDTKLMFQLVREAVLLDEGAFRRHAGADTPPGTHTPTAAHASLRPSPTRQSSSQAARGKGEN